jgi:hypothetical protein
MQRQRTLERAGWRFWRCFASRFVRERVAVVSELGVLLDSMDIKPRSASTRSVIYTSYREWHSFGRPSVQTEESDNESLDLAAPVAAFLEASEPVEVQTSASLDESSQHVTDPLRNSSRIGEAQIQTAILKLMSDGEIWTNADLKREIRKIVTLSTGDMAQSLSRPREEKWEELVNNALTQIGRSNSLYAQGLIVNVGTGRHRLKR